MDSTAVVVLLVFLVGIVPAPPEPQSVVTQGSGRTGQGADQAGPYVIGNNQDRSKQQGEVRDFLWSHWQQHRAGQLTATWISKEGAPSNDKFILEDDEHGVWSIRVIIDRPTLKDSRDRRTEYRIYSVRRVRPAASDSQGSGASIADDTQVPGTGYQLVLRDADGNKKTQL